MITGWAMLRKIATLAQGGIVHLLIIGAIIVVLEAWLVTEDTVVLAERKKKN